MKAKDSKLPTQKQAQQATIPNEQPVCVTNPLLEQRECPTCGLEMRLWAGFYRCRNCGFKESCCF